MIKLSERILDILYNQIAQPKSAIVVRQATSIIRLSRNNHDWKQSIAPGGALSGVGETGAVSMFCSKCDFRLNDEQMRYVIPMRENRREEAISYMNDLAGSCAD